MIRGQSEWYKKCAFLPKDDFIHACCRPNLTQSSLSKRKLYTIVNSVWSKTLKPRERNMCAKLLCACVCVWLDDQSSDEAERYSVNAVTAVQGSSHSVSPVRTRVWLAGLPSTRQQLVSDRSWFLLIEVNKLNGKHSNHCYYYARLMASFPRQPG